MSGGKPFLRAPILLTAAWAALLLQNTTPAEAAGTPASVAAARIDHPTALASTRNHTLAASAREQAIAYTRANAAPNAAAATPRVPAIQTVQVAPAKVVAAAQPAAATKPATKAAAVRVESGIAMHYYKGLFQQVARNRGMKLRKDVDGYASRRSCSELGSVVEARFRNPRTDRWGPWKRFQIVDCSAPRHLAYQRRLGLILEINYEQAAAAGFASRGRTAVQVRKTR